MNHFINFYIIIFLGFNALSLSSQDTLTVNIMMSKYQIDAQKILKEKYDTEQHYSNKNLILLSKYKLEELHTLSIPIFYINENRVFFNCSSSFSKIINFNQTFNNQLIVVYNKNKEIVTIITYLDSLMSINDSLWFINKVRYNEKIIYNYLNNNFDFFMFTLNDEISGLWKIDNNNIWKIRKSGNKLKYKNSTVWLLKKYSLDLIRKPITIYYAPTFLQKRLQILKIKKKNKCNKKHIKNTYIKLIVE